MRSFGDVARPRARFTEENLEVGRARTVNGASRRVSLGEAGKAGPRGGARRGCARLDAEDAGSTELGNLIFAAVDLADRGLARSAARAAGGDGSRLRAIEGAARDRAIAAASGMSTIQEALALVHTQLGPAPFDAAWEAGTKLTLDEAVALAPSTRSLMRNDLPSGTVTFLFTDVEGSTKLLHELGAEAYAEALAEHRG